MRFAGQRLKHRKEQVTSKIKKINKLIFPQWNDVLWEKEALLLVPIRAGVCGTPGCALQSPLLLWANTDFPRLSSFYDPFLAAAARNISRGRSNRWKNSFQDFAVHSFKKYCPSQERAGGRTAAGSGIGNSFPRTSGVASHGTDSPAPLGLRRSRAGSLNTVQEKRSSPPNPPPVASHGQRGEPSKKYLEGFRRGWWRLTRYFALCASLLRAKRGRLPARHTSTPECFPSNPKNIPEQNNVQTQNQGV